MKKLRATDEVAVEVTGNTRLFYEAVAPHVARVVVVDTNQFCVITQSVKKTDAKDAQRLALYLAKGLLPEVRMKDKQHSQITSLRIQALAKSNGHIQSGRHLANLREQQWLALPRTAEALARGRAVPGKRLACRG